MPQIWEQQEGESDTLFTRFLLYRDMPINERSIQKICAIQNWNVDYIYNISGKWDWVNRAKSYDIWSIEDAAAQRRQIAIFEQVTLSQFKDILQADASQDAALFLRLWRGIALRMTELVEREVQPEDKQPVLPTSKELLDLAKARDTIDVLMRRNANMPTVIKPKDVEPDDTPEDGGTYFITPNPEWEDGN